MRGSAGTPAQKQFHTTMPGNRPSGNRQTETEGNVSPCKNRPTHQQSGQRDRFEQAGPHIESRNVMSNHNNTVQIIVIIIVGAHGTLHLSD